MKVIYLAHKIRDPRGPWWMQQHIRDAESVALELWKMGAAVICPGKNTFLFDGAADDSLWLTGDLEIIKRCDAVVMHSNWTTSVGAQAERRFAINNNIPVFYWTDAGYEDVAHFVREGLQ